MLFPMWATKGCFQPFRFLDLPDQDRSKLARELEALVRAGAPEEEE
jgi:type IV secretory pathway VirB4 component